MLLSLAILNKTFASQYVLAEVKNNNTGECCKMFGICEGFCVGSKGVETTINHDLYSFNPEEYDGISVFGSNELGLLTTITLI